MACIYSIWLPIICWWTFGLFLNSAIINIHLQVFEFNLGFEEYFFHSLTLVSLLHNYCSDMTYIEYLNFMLVTILSLIQVVDLCFSLWECCPGEGADTRFGQWFDHWSSVCISPSKGERMLGHQLKTYMMKPMPKMVIWSKEPRSTGPESWRKREH